jgi:hypothetical protein
MHVNYFFEYQVINHDQRSCSFLIHWFHPSARSKERGNVYHQYCFQEENVEVAVRNQQRGARRVRLNPRTQNIDYDVVFFGFSKLCDTGALPAEVLRLLRSIGLVNGTVRRR